MRKHKTYPINLSNYYFKVNGACVRVTVTIDDKYNSTVIVKTLTEAEIEELKLLGIRFTEVKP